MITRRNLTLTLAALPFGVTKTGAAQPRPYPTKPIRFVVPFPPGGSTDVGARLIAENLSRAFGQQVYVENKSGANGTIGVEDAAKSAPDGYTILFTIDTVASNPHVFHSNIDPSKDLLPIIQVSRQPIVLAAHPSLGVNSLAELITLVKQQPGLPYATGSGLGSPQHMVVQWFAQIAGLKLEQVPYRGGGPAINDLLGGHVKLGSLGSTPLISHYKAGTLRLLAQTSKTRSPSLPDVPTFEEAGIKGLVLDQWLGVFAPAGTPSDIAERLNSEINKIIFEPETNKVLRDNGADVTAMSVDQFYAFMKTEAANYGQIIKDANLKSD